MLTTIAAGSDFIFGAGEFSLQVFSTGTGAVALNVAVAQTPEMASIPELWTHGLCLFRKRVRGKIPLDQPLVEKVYPRWDHPFARAGRCRQLSADTVRDFRSARASPGCVVVRRCSSGMRRIRFISIRRRQHHLLSEGGR